jgi:hypothetical protein
MDIVRFLGSILLLVFAGAYDTHPNSALETGNKLQLQLTGSYAAIVDGCAAQLALNMWTNTGNLMKETSKVDISSFSVTYDTIPTLFIYEPNWGGTFISFEVKDSVEPLRKRFFWGVLVSVGSGSSSTWAIYGHFSDSTRNGVFRWSAVKNAKDTYPGDQVLASNPSESLYVYTGYSNGWSGKIELDNLLWMDDAPITDTSKAQTFELHLTNRIWKYRFNGLFVRFWRPAHNQEYYGLFTSQGWHGLFVEKANLQANDYALPTFPWHAQEANYSSYCPDGYTGLKSATYAVLVNGYAGQLILNWNGGKVSGTIALEGTYLPTGPGTPLQPAEGLKSTQQVAKESGCYLYFLREGPSQQYYLVFDKYFREVHGHFISGSDWAKSYAVDGRLYASTWV